MVRIGGNSTFYNTQVKMHGRNNTLVIGANCHIGPRCSFLIEGENVVVEIGDGTTMTRDVGFTAQEIGSTIIIGRDCMFSNHIIVRNSDSHPIFDSSGRRINPPKCVTVGDHVWIAPNTTIMKGAEIGNGCVIGSNTMVTKPIPANSLAVGLPARVVRENIHWTREDVLYKSVIRDEESR